MLWVILATLGGAFVPVVIAYISLSARLTQLERDMGRLRDSRDEDARLGLVDRRALSVPLEPPYEPPGPVPETTSYRT